MKPIGFCIDCGVALENGEHWVCTYCQAEEMIAREDEEITSADYNDL